jgi:hypothetical protein
MLSSPPIDSQTHRGRHLSQRDKPFTWRLLLHNRPKSIERDFVREANFERFILQPIGSP